MHLLCLFWFLIQLLFINYCHIVQVRDLALILAQSHLNFPLSTINEKYEKIEGCQQCIGNEVMPKKVTLTISSAWIAISQMKQSKLPHLDLITLTGWTKSTRFLAVINHRRMLCTESSFFPALAVSRNGPVSAPFGRIIG